MSFLRSRQNALISILWLSVLLALSGCAEKPIVYPQPPRIGADLVIDTTSLLENVPKFYSYPSAGKTVRFFVVQTHEGVEAFLDACMKCYPKKRGFRFEDSMLSCQACTERFPVSEISRGIGSCVPIKVEDGRLVGKDYHIPAASLERMAGKF